MDMRSGLLGVGALAAAASNAFAVASVTSSEQSAEAVVNGNSQKFEAVAPGPFSAFPFQSVAGTLVTEAVRGEGGRLVNADGHRYMVDYDAERMELSTRDRVAPPAW